MIRITKDHLNGRIIPVFSRLHRPSAGCSPLTNSRLRTSLAKISWINSTAQFLAVSVKVTKGLSMSSGLEMGFRYAPSLVGSDENKQKAQLGTVLIPDTSVYSTKIYLSMTDLTLIFPQTDIQMDSIRRSR